MLSCGSGRSSAFFESSHFPAHTSPTILHNPLIMKGCLLFICNQYVNHTYHIFSTKWIVTGLSGRALELTRTGSGFVPSTHQKKSSLQRVTNFRLEIFNFMLQAMGQIKLGVSWYKQYSRKLYEKLNLVGRLCMVQPVVLGLIPGKEEKKKKNKKEGQGEGEQTKNSCEEFHLGIGLNDHVSIKRSTFPPAPLPQLFFLYGMPFLLSEKYCWVFKKQLYLQNNMVIVTLFRITKN